MATTPTTRPRVIGVAAIAPLVVLAAIIPAGLWEPAAATLGWLAVGTLTAGVLLGAPWGVAAGVTLAVVRTGILGLAGDRSPGLAVSALLIVLALELSTLSLEARTLPIDLGQSVARAVMKAAGAGGVAWLAGWILQAPPMSGTGLLLVALAAGFGSASLVLWLARRVAPPG